MDTTGRSLFVDTEAMVVFLSGGWHAERAVGETDNFPMSEIGRAQRALQGRAPWTASVKAAAFESADTVHDRDHRPLECAR